MKMIDVPPLWQKLILLSKFYPHGEFTLYFQDNRLVRFERKKSEKALIGGEVDLDMVIREELEIKSLLDE